MAFLPLLSGDFNLKIYQPNWDISPTIVETNANKRNPTPFSTLFLKLILQLWTSPHTIPMLALPRHWISCNNVALPSKTAKNGYLDVQSKGLVSSRWIPINYQSPSEPHWIIEHLLQPLYQKWWCASVWDSVLQFWVQKSVRVAFCSTRYP